MTLVSSLLDLVLTYRYRSRLHATRGRRHVEENAAVDGSRSRVADYSGVVFEASTSMGIK